MLAQSIVDCIGWTPLVKLQPVRGGRAEVYAKLELQNPFGMKDRAARQIILEARESGALAPGAPIVESSSGTMALGVALVGASLGHEVHIVTDPRIDPITLAKLKALGCRVHVVEKMTSHGWQSARLERLAELMASMPGAFWTRQYDNPGNPRGYAALARELESDLGRVDVLVGAVGSGGSLCGTARELRKANPGLLVVAVDATGSVIFGQPDRPGRLQSGLGNSLVPGNVDHAVVDEVHWLSDEEAFNATLDLAREQRIVAGNSSGSVYAVCRWLSRREAAGRNIVGILPDRGDRYFNTLYSEEYWAAKGLRRVPLPERPVEVRPDEVVTSWSFARLSGPASGGRKAAGRLATAGGPAADCLPAPGGPAAAGQPVSARRPVPPGRRLVFVEANTTGSGMIALRKAAALGLEPVFVTNNPGRYRGLDGTRCEVLVADTNEMAACRRVIDEVVGADHLAGVFTTSEFYLAVVAELAAAYGLPGNPPEAIRFCRNKAETRRLLARAGVGQPRFAVVSSPEAGGTEAAGPEAEAAGPATGGGPPSAMGREVTDEIAAALAVTGLPCVVKPVDDTGSYLVHYCETASEVADHVREVLAMSRNVRGQKTARAALVEEYVRAPEYSVESFTWQGETVVVGITEKTLAPLPHFVEWRHIFPAPLPPEAAEVLEAAAKRALATVGFRAGASHTEIKLRSLGRGRTEGPAGYGPTQVALMEINARLAGGMIPELVEAALGLDLLEQQIRVAVGEVPNLATSRARSAGIQFFAAPRPGVLAGVAGVKEARAVPGVREVTVTACVGREVAPARSAYDRLGYVIASGDTYDEVSRSLDEATSRIEVLVEDCPDSGRAASGQGGGAA